MFRKLLIVASLIGVGISSAAFASDERPSFGECASPPPNPSQCETYKY